MSHKSFRLTSAAALLAVATVLAACGSSSTEPKAPLSSGSPSAGSHPEWSQYTFTIGDNGGDGNEELAKITGVFDDAPYKVKFARFDYGPPLVQAAASGDIDLGSVGDVPPITGAAKQFGFKIVAVQRGADATKAPENIIVPKGSPIQTLADLKGKRIAVPQGSSAHGLALLALKSVGLGPKDVELVYLSPAAGGTAFNTGKVDAWSIWNPQSSWRPATMKRLGGWPRAIRVPTSTSGTGSNWPSWRRTRRSTRYSSPTVRRSPARGSSARPGNSNR
jgi:sulfonate transport system substrate-binding protein